MYVNYNSFIYIYIVENLRLSTWFVIGSEDCAFIGVEDSFSIRRKL